MEEKQVYIKISDKDHIWVEGQQYISLNRMNEIKNNQLVEMNNCQKETERLTKENDAYKVLLKDKYNGMSTKETINRIINDSKVISDAEIYIKEWIKVAEKDWCSDIQDYIGIEGLYKILDILKGE